MKSLFSDLRSAIVSIIVGALVTGTGSIYLFYKNLWRSLKSTMLSQTPLWATISLVLVVLVYTYLKTERLNQSSNSASVLNLKRTNKIEKWRSFIENFDFQNSKFGDTTVYSELRPYINQDDKDYFEDPTYFRITNNRRGNILQKQILSDLVTKIEKDWNLS